MFFVLVRSMLLRVTCWMRRSVSRSCAIACGITWPVHVESLPYCVRRYQALFNCFYRQRSCCYARVRTSIYIRHTQRSQKRRQKERQQQLTGPRNAAIADCKSRASGRTLKSLQDLGVFGASSTFCKTRLAQDSWIRCMQRRSSAFPKFMHAR